MTQKAIADVADELKEDWEQYEEDYRDDVNYEGSEIVYEDDQYVVIADRSQSVLNRITRDTDVEYRVVRNQMSDLAGELVSYDFEDSTAVVIPLQ